MRITYKGLRSGNSRVAIISYAENEENKAYEIARKFTITTSYKVDTLIYGVLIIVVDDMDDFNNVKEWYKEFKTATDGTIKETTETTNITNETSNNTTNTNETTTGSADGNNKTPADLKNDINKKFGVNTVYYDTDGILCDSEKQVVNVSHNISDTTSQPCHIKAYYDGKELTVPYSEYKCEKYAVEYIHNLYINRVVPYETLFMIYYGKHVKTITIENVIDISDLIQYNIDDINHGLKHDCYKYVLEGVNRICGIITDDMKISIDLDKTQYCTITKSRYYGYYCFKIVKAVYTKKPSDFARWLYTQTFTHRIDLKCWYRVLRGDTK